MIKTNRSYLSVLFAAVALVLASSATAFTQELSKPADTSKVSIKNFGQMDDRFFRGAQPKEGEYQELAALGITTVIDLQDDPTNYEKHDVEALGMKYINIPMSDTRYPDSAKIEQFLKLVNEPGTGKFFVHCAGGRHRTGVMGAVYRFNHYNWNYDQVYAEMKKYDFYTRWGHGEMKKFVQDYATSFQSRAQVVTEGANK